MSERAGSALASQAPSWPRRSAAPVPTATSSSRAEESTTGRPTSASTVVQPASAGAAAAALAITTAEERAAMEYGEGYRRILEAVGEPGYNAMKALFYGADGPPAGTIPSITVSFELFESVQNRFTSAKTALEQTKMELHTRHQQHAVLQGQHERLQESYNLLEKRANELDRKNTELHQDIAKQDVTAEQLRQQITRLNAEVGMINEKMAKRDEELQVSHHRVAEGLVLLSQKETIIANLRRQLGRGGRVKRDSVTGQLSGDGEEYSEEALRRIADDVEGRSIEAQLRLNAVELEAKIKRVEDEKKYVMMRHMQYRKHVQDVMQAYEALCMSREDVARPPKREKTKAPERLPTPPLLTAVQEEGEGEGEAKRSSHRLSTPSVQAQNEGQAAPDRAETQQHIDGEASRGSMQSPVSLRPSQRPPQLGSLGTPSASTETQRESLSLPPESVTGRGSSSSGRRQQVSSPSSLRRENIRTATPRNSQSTSRQRVTSGNRRTPVRELATHTSTPMLSSSPLPLSPSKSSLRQGNNSVSGSVYAATGISNAGVETREHGVQTEWTKDKSAHSTSRSTASRQQSPSVSRSWRGTPSRRTPRASPSPPSSASALFRAASPLSAGAAGGSRSGSGRGSGGKIRDRPTSKHSISVGRPSGSSSVGRAVSPLPGTLGAVLPTFQQGDGGSGSGGGGEASHVGKRTARVSSSVGEASWSLRGGEGMGSISGRTRSATNRRVRALARGYEELHKQLIALDELVVSAEKGPKDAAKVMKFFQDENNEDAATQADYMAQVVEADTQVLIHILRHLQRAPLGGASMKWRGSTGGSISGVTRPAQGLPSGTPDLRQDGAGSAQLAANSPENASIVRGPAAVAARATPTGATQAASGGSTPTALTDNLEKQVSGAGNVSVSVAGASKSEGGRAGGSNSNDIHSYDVIRGDGSVGDVAGIDREPSNAVSGDGKTPQAGLTEASASLSQQADATNALQQRGSGGWGPGGQQDGGDVSSTGVAKQLSDQHGASPSATHEPSELVGWSTPRPPTQERTRNPAGGRGADSPLPTKGAGKRPKEPQSSLTQSTKKVTPGVALPKVPLRSGRGRGNVGGDGEATTDSGGGAGTLPPRKSGGDTIEVSPTLPKLGVGARRTTPRMSDRERRRPQRIPWQPATIRLDLGEGFGPPEVGGAMTQNIYPHRPSTRTAALPWATFFHRALGQSGLPTVQHVPPQGENNTANSGNETVDRTGSGGGGAAPFIPLAPPLTSSPPFNWARFISSNQHPPRSVTEDGYNNLALDGMAIMARALEPMSPQCVPSPSPPVPPVAKVKETAPANTTGDMEQQSMPESAFSVSGHSLVTGCGSPRGATALPPPPPVGRSLDTYGASLLSYWPSANSYLSQVVYRSPAQSRRRLPNSARSYRTQDSYWRSILGLIDSRGLNNPFLSRLVAPRVVRNRPRWVPLYTSHRHVQRLSAPSLFIGQPRTCVLPPRIRSLRSFAKRLPRRSSLVKRMPSANLRRGELPPPRQPQPEHEFVPIPVRSLGGWHPPRTEKNK